MAIVIDGGITIGPGITLGGTVPPQTYPRAMGVNNAWYDIAVGGSTIVTVGGQDDNFVSAYSTNGGASWSSATLNFESLGVIYGDSKFVAVGLGTRAAYSTTGTTWTLSSTTLTNLHWADVAYGSGKFVAVAQTLLGFATDIYAYSSDGNTWTESTLPISGAWTSIIWDGSEFIAVSESGGVARSSNGTSWTAIDTAMASVNDVAYGNGYYVACRDSSATIYYSTDAITWTAKDSGSVNYSNFNVKYGNGKFIVTGGTTNVNVGQPAYVRWATDPSDTWYGSYVPSGNKNPVWHGLIYDNTLGWIATGYYYTPSNEIQGIVANSSDGLIWY